MALAILGAPAWVPYPGVRKARRGRDYIRRMVEELTAEAAARAGSRSDLLSLLIPASDPETGQAMSETDVRDNLLTFVMAGHET